MTLDAAAGGALMNKRFNDPYALIEDMAQNHYQWGSERAQVEKTQPKAGMYEVSNLDHMNARVDALYHKLDNLSLAPPATAAVVAQNCEICGVLGHIASKCQLLAETDQANYAQGNPYSNTYNPGLRNHHNFSYKNNNPSFAPSHAPANPPSFQGQQGASVASAIPKKSNLELMMENFVLAQTQQNKEFMNQNIHTNELIKQLATKVDVMATHNKMLEMQISQVAQQQAATTAPAGTFPGQPQPNPKGHANAITLRSGTELEDSVAVRVRDQDVGKDIVPDKNTESEPVDHGQTSNPKEVEENEKEKP